MHKKTSLTLEVKWILEVDESPLFRSRTKPTQVKIMKNKIKRRINTGWKALDKRRRIMRGSCPTCNQCVFTAMTYGCETWKLN